MVEDTAPYFSHFPLPDMTFQTLDVPVQYAECPLQLKCLVAILNVLAKFTSSLKNCLPLRWGSLRYVSKNVSLVSRGLLFTILCNYDLQ